MKIIRALIVCMVVLSLLVISSATFAADKAIIVGSSWYGHAPAWVAIEKGYFAEAGFDAEYRFVADSADRLTAVSTGSALFGSIGELAMITAMALGNDRFYWVGSQDIAPGWEGIVAQEWIKSIKDLKGKRVAVQFGSSCDLTLYLLAKEHGLDSYRDMQLINMSYSEMYPAFVNGNIDAAVIWEPTFSLLQEVPGAHVLGKDSDTEIYRKFKSMTGPDVLVINKAFVDRNPEKAKAFMTAYFKGVQFVIDHPEEAAQIIKAKYIPEQTVEQILEGLKGFIWLTARDQHQQVMTDQGLFGQIEYVIKFMKDTAKRIYREPNYRNWVRLDIVPSDL
ncbi:MAG: ABC transporter substrate-binding protein [Firmicutes bacterium]|nr:ABC transporter substrate-binding protein [Bacillota bacterium]